ncbi:hypothetical protein P692DRAFT_20828219 [Suillus brevipes Sb2]|nr:hypothetical protein P692DRAFT_20828219 [Suillus brevipes Sb2]
MHTRPENGLNVALADELQKSFAWIPPLTADSDDHDFLAGPESITDDELREEFERFECETQEAGQREEHAVPDILDSGIVDWSELERVDKSIAPTGFVEEINVLNRGLVESASGWNIDALLSSEGIASL